MPDFITSSLHNKYSVRRGRPRRRRLRGLSASLLTALSALIFFIQPGLPAEFSIGPTQPRTAGAMVSPGVVISQVFGGGGNSGAVLTNDFIELFNRGAAPVDLTG